MLFRSKFIKSELKDLKLIETIDFDNKFLESDKQKGIFLASGKISKKIQNIKQFLEKELT